MSPAPGAGRIVVLAGTNGGGKSSVVGEALRHAGGAYYNPDEVTRRFLERDPALSFDEANARAWRLGRLLLHRAIEQRLEFAFETTLGGRTMIGLLLKATNLGIPVHVFYVALDSADRHVARVRARVQKGGHDIPEPRIRRRYSASRANLVTLVPHLTELEVFDNSAEGDPAMGQRPEPELIVHLRRGTIVDRCALDDVPEWAKAIVLAALRVGA